MAARTTTTDTEGGEAPLPPAPKLAYLLIDASSSMRPHRQAVVDGVNTLTADLASRGVEVHVFTFNMTWKEVARPLTDATYTLAPGTRLRDSMGALIAQVRARVEGSGGALRPAHAWLVVQTDGYDTQSTTSRAAASRARRQFEAEGYRFLLMAEGRAAAAEGRALGVAVTSSIEYEATATQDTFADLARVMSASEPGVPREPTGWGTAGCGGDGDPTVTLPPGTSPAWFRPTQGSDGDPSA